MHVKLKRPRLPLLPLYAWTSRLDKGMLRTTCLTHVSPPTQELPLQAGAQSYSSPHIDPLHTQGAHAQLDEPRHHSHSTPQPAENVTVRHLTGHCWPCITHCRSHGVSLTAGMEPAVGRTILLPFAGLQLQARAPASSSSACTAGPQGS